MPAAALANAYDDTLREYRTTGAVNGCGYTAAQLAEAKAQTPKNINDIAPGYPTQLAVAAAKRAKGCTKAEEKAAKTTAAAGATTATTGTGTTAPGATGTGAATQPPATTTVAPNATTAAAAPVPAPATTTAPAPVPATQSTASHKGARLALIVIGALLVMLLALWAFARWWAWEPQWLARWRHATAEAGWRASAAWAEFTDWLRLGR
jgi:cobalamin biosynthesis Mg chelatase CobN